MALTLSTTRALRRLEARLNTPTFVWKGHTIPCVPSSQRVGAQIDLGGYVYTVSLTIIVRKAVMPTGITVDSTLITIDTTHITADMTEAGEPFPGEKVGRSSKQYRVVNITQPSTGDVYELDLANVNA